MNALSLFVGRFTTQRNRKKPTMQYDVNLAHFAPELVEAFVQLDCDDETQVWLRSALGGNITSSCLQLMLMGCFSMTTANGLARKCGMHVLSSAQAQVLLNRGPDDVHGTLLDIGAGDGCVTAKLRPFFSEVFVTETNAAMRWRLRSSGLSVVDADMIETVQHDVISCLNVLDRCDKPLTMLRNIRRQLKPGGLALIAVVLPWCPFVERGLEQQQPSETLPMAGGMCRDHPKFETAAKIFFDRVVVPAGFNVQRWSRVPYLSEGDSKSEYYLLDDLIMVLNVATGDQKALEG